MNYDKYFDVNKSTAKKGVPKPKPGKHLGADRRDGLVYVYNDKIELAVNVALATRRPMLLRGPSGSGKSSLARNIARRLHWWYYEQVITSRTQARDLQWSFDTLRRLSDAQAKQLNNNTNVYIEPGILWWAFDPTTAEKRGQKNAASDALKAKNPGVPPENRATNERDTGAVVLLDEIDKADPDVPNNLLVQIGSLEFKLNETGVKLDVTATRPLLILITTNDERVLPNAFMRRCVVLELEPPDEVQLVKIANEHFGADKKNLYDSIARKVIALAPSTDAARAASSGQPAPSAAEFLDTVRACLELNVNPDTDDDAWQAISNATLLKKVSV
ncbi:MAG TPA: MoxR family ATPase [Pyrinomonadaceae bacterium]|jgi:MoxR-like ATPase|nr:MoxR family ATPase [Pyrinomonadaceae bacterium]